MAANVGCGGFGQGRSHSSVLLLRKSLHFAFTTQSAFETKIFEISKPTPPGTYQTHGCRSHTRFPHFLGLTFLGFFAGRIFKVPSGRARWLKYFHHPICSCQLWFFQLFPKRQLRNLRTATYVFSTTFPHIGAFASRSALGFISPPGPMSRVATIQGMVGRLCKCRLHWARPDRSRF